VLTRARGFVAVAPVQTKAYVDKYKQAQVIDLLATKQNVCLELGRFRV